MANADIEGRVTDRRRVQGSDVLPGSLETAPRSVSAMRARLFTINSTSYGTLRLNQMTKNDMEYALRVHDNAAGI